MNKVLLYPFYRRWDWGSRMGSDLPKATKPITGRDLSRAQTLCTVLFPVLQGGLPSFRPQNGSPQNQRPRVSHPVVSEPALRPTNQTSGPHIRPENPASSSEDSPGCPQAPEGKGHESKCHPGRVSLPGTAALSWGWNFFCGNPKPKSPTDSSPGWSGRAHTEKLGWKPGSEPWREMGECGKENRGCSLFAQELITELILKYWFSPVMSWLLWAESKPPTHHFSFLLAGKKLPIMLFSHRWKQVSHHAPLPWPNSRIWEQNLHRQKLPGWGEMRRKEMKNQKKKETREKNEIESKGKKMRREWGEKWLLILST